MFTIDRKVLPVSFSNKKMLPKKPDETLITSERRQSNRKKFIVNVAFEGGGVTGIANTRDIGLGGLYIAAAVDCEVGTRLRLQLTLSGGRAISLDGMIIYTDPGQGIGVRFLDLSEDERSILKKELELEESFMSKDS